MAPNETSEIIAAIARLQAEHVALNNRLDRADTNRDKHLERIYKKLGALEKDSNIARGKKMILTSLGLAAAGAVGSLISKFLL